MTALVVRELLVLSSRPPFAAATILFVVVMAGFAVAWPAGVPLYSGATLFTQIAILGQWLMVLIAPWVVCRCSARERGDALVHLSLLAAVRPSRIIANRFVASLIALLVLYLAALPVLIYAQQVDMASGSVVAAVFLESLSTIVVGGASALTFQQTMPDPVAAWAAATGVSVFLAIIALSADGILVAAVAGGASTALLLAVASRADRVCRYVLEEEAP